MSNVRWQRDCLPRKRRGFVVPPRSDVIARTRNEEEAISKRHDIFDMTLSYSKSLDISGDEIFDISIRMIFFLNYIITYFTTEL